jgi:signal transduction histidine kinase
LRHVNDLLDVSRLEAGRMSLDPARTDVADLARHACSHFDALARERRIGFVVDLPHELLAEVDAEKLLRVMLNLLSNAFKFTPDGGTIDVRLHESKDVGGQAVIEVQDNGPGVPEAMREAVFERFRQVEGAANRRHGGTGLGLAIVKEFTALHGGDASVSAAPGSGALFAVRLPLKAPAGARLQEATAQLDPILARQAREELAAPGAPAAADRTPTSHDARWCWWWKTMPT